MRFNKKLIICILAFLVLFVIVNEIVFYLTKSEQSTLIGCVFAFCGFEGGILGMLKKAERKCGVDKNENSNTETIQ